MSRLAQVLVLCVLALSPTMALSQPQPASSAPTTVTIAESDFARYREGGNTNLARMLPDMFAYVRREMDAGRIRVPESQDALRVYVDNDLHGFRGLLCARAPVFCQDNIVPEAAIKVVLRRGPLTQNGNPTWILDLPGHPRATSAVQGARPQASAAAATASPQDPHAAAIRALRGRVAELERLERERRREAAATPPLVSAEEIAEIRRQLGTIDTRNHGALALVEGRIAALEALQTRSLSQIAASTWTWQEAFGAAVLLALIVAGAVFGFRAYRRASAVAHDVNTLKITVDALPTRGRVDAVAARADAAFVAATSATAEAATAKDTANSAVRMVQRVEEDLNQIILHLTKDIVLVGRGFPTQDEIDTATEDDTFAALSLKRAGGAVKRLLFKKRGNEVHIRGLGGRDHVRVPADAARVQKVVRKAALEWDTVKGIPLSEEALVAAK